MSGILNLLLAGAASVIKDAYFNLVTLLLNTTATNGAQNNTFLDSSTNNFTITRNGNATQGTFTPFSQTGWSNFFDGTASTYLSITSNAAFAFGTGAYTVEGWVYLNARATNETLLFASGGSGGAFLAFITNTGAVKLENFGGSTVATGSAGDVPLNAWCHVAYVRTSTSTNAFNIYVNGVVKATGTDANNWANSAAPVIGMLTANTDYAVKGYVSNFRIVKGTAVYTSAFTPPTTPLTSISGTSVLTCQSNRFVDNSSNAFTITPTGAMAVQAFSPFAPTAAYDAAVVGGSGYFDGAGDSLTTSGANLAVGTGDFTYQFWMYALANNKSIFDTRTVNNTTTGFTFLLNSSNFLSIYTNSSILTASTAVTLNAWNFVSLVRSSGTLTIYLNGVSVGSAAFSNNLTDSTIKVGNYVDDSGAYLGYISGLQILKGTAASGAILTAPPTNITNTQLLLNYTNAGIYDSAAKNVLETVGNAQVSTTQSKWGTTSLYCPATNGNYFISPPNQPNLLFGTGNFTVEAWIYPTAFTNTATGLIGYGLSGGYVDWNLEISTSGAVLYIDNDGGRFTSSSNLSTNVWTHIAIARTNTAVTMYFNGTSVGSYSTINNISGSSTSARLYVGTGAQQPGSRQFIGYIDDPRITKGYARYTANFTAPTEAFPLQ
jgi:hypothetical protein